MKQNFGNWKPLDIYSNYLYHKIKCFSINMPLPDCQLDSSLEKVHNEIHKPVYKQSFWLATSYGYVYKLICMN